MPAHPIATAAQHEHERSAVELFAHPTVRGAHDKVRKEWLRKTDPGAEETSCFEWAFEEVMFSAVVWSSNQDPLRPEVVTITRLEHPLGELRVPGTRWGIDNPDSIYRVIPISGSEKYRIHGRVAERRLTENYFTLWDDRMNTIDVLSGHDLELDADRSFTVDVDPEPANGRANHITSAAGARELYIRDVLLDWGADDPNELTVERLGGPPTTAAMTVDEQAELTAKFMWRFAELTYGWNERRFRSPANEIGSGWTRDTGGALRNQVYIPGRFSLDEGAVLVLHVDDGGAEYFTVPITNMWGTTMDIVDRTSTLNKAQSEANPDGTYTYVLSGADPGVHNWLDTCGLSSGMLTVRMAEFAGGRPDVGVGVRGEVVKFDELDRALPSGTRSVTESDRARQRADRAAAYLRRLPEV